MASSKNTPDIEYINIENPVVTINGERFIPAYNRLAAAVHMGIAKGGKDYAVMRLFKDDEVIRIFSFECKLTAPEKPKSKKGRTRQDDKYLGVYLASLLFYKRLKKKELAYDAIATLFGYEGNRATMNAVKVGRDRFSQKFGDKGITMILPENTHPENSLGIAAVLFPANTEQTVDDLHKGQAITCDALVYIEGETEAVFANHTIRL